MTLSSDTTKPDLHIQSILADIEKVRLEHIVGKTFVDTDVYLDGREFIDCIFKNSRLFLKLGCFKIRGERIHLEGCTFMTDGPAQVIRSLVELLAGQPHRTKG